MEFNILQQTKFFQISWNYWTFLPVIQSNVWKYFQNYKIVFFSLQIKNDSHELHILYVIYIISYTFQYGKFQWLNWTDWIQIVLNRTTPWQRALVNLKIVFDFFALSKSFSIYTCVLFHCWRNRTLQWTHEQKNQQSNMNVINFVCIDCIILFIFERTSGKERR